eukprot:CFRG8178T1
MAFLEKQKISSEMSSTRQADAFDVEVPVYILAFTSKFVKIATDDKQQDRVQKDTPEMNIDVDVPNQVTSLAQRLTTSLLETGLHVSLHTKTHINNGLPFLIVTMSRASLFSELGHYRKTNELEDYFLYYSQTPNVQVLRSVEDTVSKTVLTSELAERLLRARINASDASSADGVLVEESVRERKIDIPLVDDLQSRGLLEVFLLHDDNLVRSIQDSAIHSFDVPIQAIYEYFGSKLAMYYAWCACYNRMLVIPAVTSITWVGLGTEFGIGLLRDSTNDFFTALYAILMVLWGSTFIKKWEREASQWSLRWGSGCTVGVEGSRRAILESERVLPDFQGDKRTDPVTGLSEIHFDAKKRRIRTLRIAPIILLMCIAAIVVMTFGLNITGYVGVGSPIYVKFLNSRNPGHPGLTFPDDPLFIHVLPSIIHSGLIVGINMWFAQIAVELTKYQNWRTQEEFETSLIYKRVPFEMFACYLSLFYLTFYEKNMTMLKSNLRALFLADTLRRVVTELCLPYVRQRYTMYKIKKRKGELAQAVDNHASPSADKLAHEGVSEGVEELEWPSDARIAKAFVSGKRQDFDDYIELVVQFGYIVLFAGAFPMASFFGLIGNFIEVRSDLSKHLHVTRREPSLYANNIGPWLPVLKIISDFSVLTNAVIFGYTSTQIDNVLFVGVVEGPVESYSSSDRITDVGLGTRLAIILVLEHLLFIGKRIIETTISSVEVGVKRTYLRRDYIRSQALKQFNMQQENRKMNVLRKKNN